MSAILEYCSQCPLLPWPAGVNWDLVNCALANSFFLFCMTRSRDLVNHKKVVTQNGWKKWKWRVSSSNIAKFETPGIKEWIFIGVWIVLNITKIWIRMENVAGEHRLLVVDLFSKGLTGGFTAFQLSGISIGNFTLKPISLWQHKFLNF